MIIMDGQTYNYKSYNSNIHDKSTHKSTQKLIIKIYTRNLHGKSARTNYN